MACAGKIEVARDQEGIGEHTASVEFVDERYRVEGHLAQPERVERLPGIEVADQLVEPAQVDRVLGETS